MSETKFTPGKWDRYNETPASNIFIEAHDHGSICKIANNFYAEGNARLILAAPELLEASTVAEREFIGLAAYLGTCAHDVILDNLPSTIASLEAKARLLAAAIRKAKGE